MKAVSVTQPWASLLAAGIKRIETRSWATRYRGPIAIHAAKGYPRWAREFAVQPVVYNAWRGRLGDWPSIDLYPRGCVLATAFLSDCLPVENYRCLPGVFEDYPEFDTPQERAFGDFTEGRWGWVITDVRPLAKSIPAKGALGLWEWQAPHDLCFAEGK